VLNGFFAAFVKPCRCAFENGSRKPPFVCEEALEPFVGGDPRRVPLEPVARDHFFPVD
jgi:hypothetical protein